jgi:hypothetical protein
LFLLVTASFVVPPLPFLRICCQQAFLKEKSPMRKRLLVRAWEDVREALIHVSDALKAAKDAKTDAASSGANQAPGATAADAAMRELLVRVCCHVLYLDDQEFVTKSVTNEHAMASTHSLA